MTRCKLMPDEIHVEEMRLLVRWCDNMPEAFTSQYTAAELVKLLNASRLCAHAYTPDEWSEAQVRFALRGIVPDFDEDGAAIKGMTPLVAQFRRWREGLDDMTLWDLREAIQPHELFLVQPDGAQCLAGEDFALDLETLNGTQVFPVVDQENIAWARARTLMPHHPTWVTRTAAGSLYCGGKS